MTRRTFEQAWRAVAEVEGWMSLDQANRLYDAAARVPSGGRIVEIGSYHGRSAIVMASAADPTVEVVAIDPHAGNDRGPRQWDGAPDDGEADHQTFVANVAAAGLADRIRHVRARSEDAIDLVPGPIDVLYVDGSHRFGAARGDIRRWGARVRPGGTMLVHDAYSSVGVTLALLTTTMSSARWQYVGRSRSLAEYRMAPLAAGSRAGNVARQLQPVGWFGRNLAIKTLMVARLPQATRLLGHDGRTWPY